VATVPAEVQGPSDAELITSVRDGDVDAYGALYERHVNAAYNLARQLTRSGSEADDLVSEAFARVLDTLRGGRGPDSAFRAYLLTSLRHLAYDKTRRDRRLELAEDVEAVSGIDTEKISSPFKDTAIAGLERSLAARAFERLPERWQAVLWHTEIEGQTPAEVAPILGLTANGVSALAYRAREGLRQAYLQVYLAETASLRCRATVDKLGAWTRGGLSKRETAQVEAHLDECDRCRALAAELADVNSGMRVVALLVLGAGTAGYLALAGKAAATTAVVGAAAAGGAAGGAASSVPRQFLGVGASVAAVAAAIALALTSGGGQHIPAVAAPAPPPVVKPVKPPAPAKPAPNKPAPPPSTSPPASQPPKQQAPTTPAPPPPPGQPTLTASGPSSTVVLTPGGGPVDVPITVRNSGASPSQPVSAALNLPPGVTAVGSGQHFGAARPLVLDAPSTTAATSQVDCPGGSGTVTCTSPSGLQPGQSVVLLFVLEADQSAQDGQITGTVMAGGSLTVRVTVQVHVPPLRDALTLRASADESWPWLVWPFDPAPALARSPWTWIGQAP
jgi:RNA polymerase sigma factor (sigma-70 family)